MMGRTNDTMAVVDSKARVIGVTGLRVIDSSSFRFTPPGHTQAATCEFLTTFEIVLGRHANLTSDAHAEKLADDIKNALSGN